MLARSGSQSHPPPKKNPTSANESHPMNWSEMVIFENCKNIAGFLRIMDVNHSTVHNA